MAGIEVATGEYCSGKTPPVSPSKSSELLCRAESEKLTGIEKFLEPADGRRDLFEADEGYYHFPCGECKSRKRPSVYCRKCRHFCK